MFEFHGWAVLRYHSHDTNEQLQDDEFDKFCKYIKDIDSMNLSKITRYNGQDSFLVSGLHNHKQQYVLEIFTWIASNLPGSYGLLYINDSDDFNETNENTNKFFVWRLAKGKLLLKDDSLLSPIVPTIEDEFDPSRDD